MTVVATRPDLVYEATEVTTGRMAEVVTITASAYKQQVKRAMEVARTGGTVVLGEVFGTSWPVPLRADLQVVKVLNTSSVRGAARVA